MTDFFTALEGELRAAALRRPRRAVGLGQALGVLVLATLLGATVFASKSVLGGNDHARPTGAPRPDPVGTVLPKSKTHLETRALVVANGTAPGFGPWQIEVSRTRGERDTHGGVMWHRGYCLWINVLGGDPMLRGRSGHCGGPRTLGFRKTPGFSRSQTATSSKPPARSDLVWGRVPDRASKVVITAPGHRPIEVIPEEGPNRFPGQFYAIPVRRGMPRARINWLDANGNPGSRGIRLMPPITRY